MLQLSCLVFSHRARSFWTVFRGWLVRWKPVRPSSLGLLFERNVLDILSSSSCWGINCSMLFFWFSRYQNCCFSANSPNLASFPWLSKRGCWKAICRPTRNSSVTMGGPWIPDLDSWNLWQRFPESLLQDVQKKTLWYSHGATVDGIFELFEPFCNDCPYNIEAFLCGCHVQTLGASADSWQDHLSSNQCVKM